MSMLFNHMPHFNVEDKAMMKRLYILQFRSTFVDANDANDPEVDEKKWIFLGDKSKCKDAWYDHVGIGLLYLLVDANKVLRDNAWEVDVSAHMIAEKAKFMSVLDKPNSSMGMFIFNHIQKGERDDWIHISDLHSAWEKHADYQGENLVAMRKWIRLSTFYI